MNGMVLLLGQGVVNLVQVSNSRVGETTVELNIPTITFDCGFDMVSFSLLFMSLHSSVTAINLKLGFISKEALFPLIHCKILVSLSPAHGFGLV